MNPFVHLNFWTLYICTFRTFLENLLGIFFFYCLFGVVRFGFILWVFLLVLSLYWTSVWCPFGMSTLRLEPCGLGRFSLHSQDSLTILPTGVLNAVALSLPSTLGGTEGKNQPQQWGMWRVPGEVEAPWWGGGSLVSWRACLWTFKLYQASTLVEGCSCWRQSIPLNLQLVRDLSLSQSSPPSNCWKDICWPSAEQAQFYWNISIFKVV